MQLLALHSTNGIRGEKEQVLSHLYCTCVRLSLSCRGGSISCDVTPATIERGSLAEHRQIRML